MSSAPAPLEAYVNTFAGNPLDRGGDKRSDPAWVEERLKRPGAQAMALWSGRPFVEPGPADAPRLAWLKAGMAREAVGGSAERMLYLGDWKDEPVWAVEFDGAADPAAGPLEGLGRFEELRGLASLLPAAEAAMAATAKSLFDWRGRHRFCSACGHESETIDGGWKRVCPRCRVEHFPRTDPVTIMLPVYGERCLLGRQAAWPQGRMSALAGFLEPGESIEEACARELKEEAGLVAVRVRYHSSQPWPFPSQLMIGLIAEVQSDEARPDGSELEQVDWFSREEAARMVAGDVVRGTSCAPPLAIAHHLLKAWSQGF